MSVLMFFPWVAVQTEVKVGDFRLLPYERDSRPSGRGTPAQDLADAILGSFHVGPEQAVHSAAILAPAGDDITRDLTDEEMAQAFIISELIAIAGLAQREFFQQMGYCNRDNFAFVMQGFEGTTTSGVTIRSRRRDGQNLGYWPLRYYKVQRPDHLSLSPRIEFPSPLLDGLLAARESPTWDRYLESIRSFNQANTDSPAVSDAAEVIFTMSAFERLLDASSQGGDLVKKLASVFAPTAAIPKIECARIQRSPMKFKAAETVAQAWVLDFHALRGSLAHGNAAGKYPSVWSLREHLLLGSYLYPLLLKLQLAKDGTFALDDDDRADVDSFEKIAALDNAFAGTKTEEGPTTWAWCEIIAAERDRFHLERATAALKEALAKTLAPG